MKKAQLNIGGTLLKLLIGTSLLLVLGAVAFLSREIQPNIHQVTKTLDNTKLEDKAE